MAPRALPLTEEADCMPNTQPHDAETSAPAGSGVPRAPVSGAEPIDYGRSRHPAGTRRRLLQGLICLIGLSGLPLVLDGAMWVADTPNDGFWFLLLPVLVAIGWVLVVVGLWSTVK